MRAELFGANTAFDDRCKSKLRTWKDELKKTVTGIDVTKHCHVDDFSGYLHTHFDYVQHENLPNGETNMIYWCSEGQRENYRRFHDVIIIDATAGKNVMN